MLKDKIKLYYFKLKGFKIKLFNYYIQLSVYKKDFYRGTKWFEITPADSLNTNGNLYSSLFFHLFVEKELFVVPNDWNHDEYNNFCSANKIDYSRKDNRRLKREYMKWKYNMDI